uniref:Uncharacterized protein n=1 Tax=Glossina brevipalpis TaxID=37001 RepID=A0A1A9X5E0_9MUSC
MPPAYGVPADRIFNIWMSVALTSLTWAFVPYKRYTTALHFLHHLKEEISYEYAINCNNLGLICRHQTRTCVPSCGSYLNFCDHQDFEGEKLLLNTTNVLSNSWEICSLLTSMLLEPSLWQFCPLQKVALRVVICTISADTQQGVGQSQPIVQPVYF